MLAGLLALILAMGAAGALASVAVAGQSDLSSGPVKVASVKPITLKYATYISSTNFIGQVDVKYFQKVQQETKNRVRVIPYWNSTLFDARQWYTELMRGTADIVHVQPGTEKERFPLYTAVSNFGYGVVSSEALRAAYEELWRTAPALQAEFKKNDVKPLVWFTPGEAWVHSNKPIRKASDFKGLKIRCADDQSFALVKALGATPVRMPISEVYHALQKNMVDGVLTSMDTITDYRFIEVTKYHTRLPYYLSWVVYRAVKESRWNELPADIRAAFEKNADWWETQAIEGLKQRSREAMQAAKEKGNPIIELPASDQNRIVGVLEANARALAKELDAKGYPATQILQQTRQLIAKYNKIYKK
jgi:TRAP-type C4-dicarboxylate transport system substrate-binding protein